MERHRDEGKLQTHQWVLAGIASRLVRADSNDIDAEINRALEVFGALSGAVRAAVWIQQESWIEISHEWIRDEGGRPRPRRLPLEVFPHYRQMLSRGESVVVGRYSEIPAVATCERSHAEAHGFEPLVFTPLRLSDKLLGAIGLYGASGEERTWDGDLVSLLEIAGAVIISAMQRRDAEMGLRQNQRERRQLEMLLLQAQKLESLGLLAGGIAHDFNNLLAGILGNLELASFDLPEHASSRDALLDAQTAARRAAELTRQLLAYSGQGRYVVEPVDLRRLLDEMLRMLNVSVSKKAVLHLDLDRELPRVQADAAQLRQVVMNLVINASEAIGDQPGSIGLSTGIVDCATPFSPTGWPHEAVAAGRIVWIEVKDTGSGMDSATRSRIFDPFFSTKFTGRGLGLPAVLGIVRGHKGALEVATEPGRGSTFRVYLPALPAAAEKVRDACGGQAPAREWRGEGTVLLVDDDETVRRVGKRMLERLGFSVLLAENGREGVEMYRNNAASVRCVLLDLTMPEMDGVETYFELRRQTQMPVVLTSGYNDQQVEDRFGAERSPRLFLKKPFDLDGLRSMLQQVLAASPTGQLR